MMIEITSVVVSRGGWGKGKERNFWDEKILYIYITRNSIKTLIEV